VSDVSDEHQVSAGQQRLIGEVISSGKIITARGTEDGLVLRIDGRAEWEEILLELRGFLSERKSFLEGGTVSLEWLDRLPTKLQSSELETLLGQEYGVRVQQGKKKAPQPRSEAVDKAGALRVLEARKARTDVAERLGLGKGSGDGKDSASEFETSQLDRIAEMLGEQTFYDDDANAKIYFGTLRSGQRVETPFSLIVIGDVNPGADLIAGGDIIVLGSLRGTAHASAYDEDCLDRIIIALQMQPMQLRIGSVISRGNGESGGEAEIARIEERRIVVDSYRPRNFQRGRFR